MVLLLHKFCIWILKSDKTKLFIRYTNMIIEKIGNSVPDSLTAIFIFDVYYRELSSRYDYYFSPISFAKC